MKVNIEFSGGLETLFEGQKNLTIQVEESKNIADLIKQLKTDHLKQHPDLFVNGDNLRAGILVLINDVDWELNGTEDYVLEANDRIAFISTLHGG